MKRNENSRIPGAQNQFSGLQMNKIERARAEEGMKNALVLADLTLSGVARVRSALNSAGHAMYLAFGQRRA
jgi:hypothetical protein